MTEISLGKRTYLDPLSDMPDQYLFFGTFVLGAVAICLTKWLNVNQYIVTAIPVCLMAGYAIIALVTKRYRLREDKVGDNIYYLGFLFTLVSLAYALHVYDPNGAGASTIITNFGIAIFTTIVGLAGRVLFNQMREDPVEYEREARFSLGEAARGLRAQLSDISTDFSQFKRKTVQIAEEGVRDVTESAKQAMTEGAAQFAQSAKEVIETIDGAFNQFTDHSTRLNDIAGKNVEALQALFVRIEHIEASPDLLAAKLTPIVNKFAEIADDAMRRNRNQTNDLKRVHETIEVAVKAADTLRTSISKLDGAANERLSVLANGYQDILDKALQFIRTLETSGGTFASEMSAARQRSEELVALLEQETKAITNLHREIDADLELVRQHRAEIAKLADEGRDSVQSVQGSLVSLSKTLVEQLDGRHSA